MNEIESIELEKKSQVTQSQIPTVGEFCLFSDTGNIGRGKSKISNLDICLGVITSTTPLKPCLQYMSGSKGKMSTNNVCLIPDLSIKSMIDFIKLFKRLRLQKLSDLMVGKVEQIKGKKENVYKPKRPRLFWGNFPNAPKSSALGVIALLGEIGEMVKEQDVSELAMRVLDSFKRCNFYAFQYGDAKVFKFDHHIIELAKHSRLRRVVDSLYYVSLYNQERRNLDNVEYQKFDLFASQFLQQFNEPSFRDFLAFRAEYPNELEILLKTYFMNMEHISEEVIQSAKELGQWLNSVAYRVAYEEVERQRKQDNIEGQDRSKRLIRNIKAKVLIELESSIFASKSADALIAYTITRAGRLSATDAPAEASLFMEKTMSGEVSLEQAKNLLISFSRLRSKSDKKGNAEMITEEDNELEQDETSRDLSDL